MKLQNIDHLVLITKNLQACLQFYVDILGMKHTEQNGHHNLYFGSSKISIHQKIGEFNPFAANAAVGAEDFCIIAEGNILDILQYLQSQDCKIIDGVVERHGALGIMDSVYLRDPDGNLVEISVYRKI